MDGAVTTLEVEEVEEDTTPEVVEDATPEVPVPKVVIVPPSPIDTRDFVNNLKGIYSSYSN
jgi:hypothetical protein